MNTTFAYYYLLEVDIMATHSSMVGRLQCKSYEKEKEKEKKCYDILRRRLAGTEAGMLQVYGRQ